MKKDFFYFLGVLGDFAYREVGEGREHDCMDAGGRAASGTAAEERKLGG